MVSHAHVLQLAGQVKQLTGLKYGIVPGLVPGAFSDDIVSQGRFPYEGRLSAIRRASSFDSESAALKLDLAYES